MSNVRPAKIFRMSDHHQIEIDWSEFSSEKELWDAIVSKSGHPTWHGCNLDALNDSWVTGGLDEHGPPYEFLFKNCESVPVPLRELAKAIMNIAQLSVNENGGSLRQA